MSARVLTALVVPLGLTGAPVMAESWEIAFSVGPEISLSGAYSGTFMGYGAGDFRERYGAMYAYTGPEEPRDVTCETSDWFEIDMAFGEIGHHSLQLLFGLERIGEDQWRVDIPAAFLNIETWDDPTAVLLERYEGPRVTVNEVTCEANGELTVDVQFDFSGAPDTDKGPGFLEVSGRVRATMSLFSYDDY